jgi:hypothetical protein
MAISLASTLPSGTDAQQIGSDASGGMKLGSATSEAVAFFGSTPTTQPTAAGQAAPASTDAVSVSATQWAYGTSTQADALVDCVIAVRSALVTLGLIKGS